MRNIINAVLYGVDVVGIDLDTHIQVLTIPHADPADFHEDWYMRGDYPIKVGGTYPLED